MTDICVSIVSHGQARLVNHLLDDLHRVCHDVDVVVTSNITESEPLDFKLLSRGRYIENRMRKGFGANHNAAFRQCESPFFCVANPDIRILSDPFPGLREAMNNPKVGLAVPLVLNPAGGVEDSVRRFPTPLGIVRKAAGMGDGRYVVEGAHSMPVDWAAGMFMFFRSEAFADIQGFDENFFLYYEDVDICARLWKAGWQVVVVPMVSVVHAAQRSSRRNPRYLAWHLSSMAKYFTKHLGRLPRIGSDR